MPPCRTRGPRGPSTRAEDSDSTGFESALDTTLSDYGGDKVKGGQLVFDKVIKAQTQG